MVRRKHASITARQRAAFWSAHRAACGNLWLSTAQEREEYRKRVMREECGKEHLADLGRTADFDKVMRRFAFDAGEYETACRFACGDEARKIALIKICCAQVLQLKGEQPGSASALDYLAGIVEQARIPCGRDLTDSSLWMDVAPESMMSLFQILDTYRRRLLRRLIDGRTERTFIGFDPSLRYEPLSSGGVRIVFDGDHYDSTLLQIRVVVRR